MKLRLQGEASAELEAAAEWYERQRRGLGDDLLAEVGRALLVIGERPEAWPRTRAVRRRDVRQFVLPRFPILVVYAIRDEQLLVVAFAHSHRRPGYWRERLRPL